MVSQPIVAATIHDQAFEYYSWNQLGSDVYALAKQLLDDDSRFDRLIALAKGGLAPARALADFLKIDQLSSIQVEFYTGIGQRGQTPVITQSLPVQIKGERVLVFDDIVDSGKTFALASSYLTAHGAAEISTAALIVKPWTKHRPDYAVHTTEAWVIMPNEVRETIELLSQSWREKGDSTASIKRQLRKIGFDPGQVDDFV
ncbi:MAG: phosphoribosyltransferase [Candidatus Pacebacteria bacterium CG10_big_fil_rev_8_21_14_0_10_56_10]|nr:MAG: phosphoribosyltransferase [Candidatus Pacebacteria bacterium CG10_big_fil_rev_8_21_14_0_10_56_10]